MSGFGENKTTKTNPSYHNFLKRICKTKLSTALCWFCRVTVALYGEKAEHSIIEVKHLNYCKLLFPSLTSAITYVS